MDEDDDGSSTISEEPMFDQSSAASSHATSSHATSSHATSSQATSSQSNASNLGQIPLPSSSNGGQDSLVGRDPTVGSQTPSPYSTTDELDQTIDSAMDDSMIGSSQGQLQQQPCSITTSVATTDVRSLLVPSTSGTSSMNRSGKVSSIEVKFNQDRAKLKTFLTNLRSQPDAIYFNEPVDPIKHLCANYFDVIKNPMDLSTMEKKLLQPDCVYLRNPWKFMEDFDLIVTNAFQYNHKTPSEWIYRRAQSLNEIFLREIDPVFKSIGMCCGKQYRFRARALACYAMPANGCHVARDKPYYLYNDRYSVCVECYIKAKDECPGPFHLRFITIFKNQSDPKAINDTTNYLLEEFRFVDKNSHEEPEPYLTCAGVCKRAFHSICVNHPDGFYDSPFICNSCLLLAGKNPLTDFPKRKYTSKSLPVNCLSRYLETRVRYLLKKCACSDVANLTHIRVISTANKECKVKEKMLKTYSESQLYPESFPYRSKSIFAFQEDPSDRSEVCFFGMHVNEYDHTCGEPNKKRVYISYLDSVFFFRPRFLKTAVYREIVLSYLDYVKQLGYRHGSIWSCPPSDGDDYIFYAHPKDQKIPKSNRLLTWYKELLDSAMMRKIVIEWNDLRKQATIDKMKRVTELPYFDGDFWPGEIERSISELVQAQFEERDGLCDLVKDSPSSATRKRSRSNSGTSTSSNRSNKSGTSCKSGQKREKGGRRWVPKKRRHSGSEAATSSSSNPSVSTPSVSTPQAIPDARRIEGREGRKGSDQSESQSDKFHVMLNSIILKKIEDQADVFFSLKLLPETAVNFNTDIHDPDPVLNCHLFDGRESFLTYCRASFHEFSTLRRAKYSTSSMLKTIHETLTHNTGDLIDAIHHVIICSAQNQWDDTPSGAKNSPAKGERAKNPPSPAKDEGAKNYSSSHRREDAICGVGSLCYSLWSNYLSKRKSDPGMEVMVKFGNYFIPNNPSWRMDRLLKHLLIFYFMYHRNGCDADSCTSSVCKTLREHFPQLVTETALSGERAVRVSLASGHF